MSANVERIRDWCLALKSNQYHQGFNQLRTPNGYCCLGVACDLSQLGRWSLDGNYIIPGGIYGQTVATIVMPRQVVAWLELDVDSPYIATGRGRSHREGLDEVTSALTDLNDGGFSFDQIADLIWWQYGDGTAL